MAQSVAIVGAGVSGLASIKCCLDEGLQPTCFERSDDIGGLWKFTEIPQKGRLSVYRSVVSNTSKEMSCFSDLPFPEDWPNYLHHSALLKYLNMFAERFHLLDYIHFKTTVCSIRKHPLFSTTGQWIVDTEKNGQHASAVFDAVMVCSGRYAEINLPLDSFPGIEDYKGHIFHSSEYRDERGLEGKNVIVVGIGNSGGDIAVEISRVAAKVFLSTRSGTWVSSRVSDNGWPLDMVYTTRFNTLMERVLPQCILSKIRARKFSQWFNHENYGLIPTKRPWFSLILNDELPAYILRGTVVVKPNIKRFTETSAIFEDGTVAENVDVVIFTTGFLNSFSFLEESLSNTCKSNVSLYKEVFPPHLEKPTLAVIGSVPLTGAILPGAELQARWVTRVFNGMCKLPPVSRMMNEVTQRKKDLLKKGITSDQDKAKRSFVAYMDEIADFIGVKPNVPLLLLLDPKLALAVIFGPCTPYQYRLTGPGKWVDARSMILTQWDRVLKPMKTRVVDDSPKPALVSYWLKVLGLPTFLGAAMLFFKYWSPSRWPQIKW